VVVADIEVVSKLMAGKLLSSSLMVPEVSTLAQFLIEEVSLEPVIQL